MTSFSNSPISGFTLSRWVILAINWFLAAGMRWTSEAIAQQSTKFHFFAWFLPFGQSIAVLASKAVDGDPIAGICHVGNHNLFNLQVFVVGPYCVYLAVGLGFLLAGFCAMRKIVEEDIRLKHGVYDHQRQQRPAEKAEAVRRLMRRIAIYSLCTFLPIAAMVGCYVYEMNNRHLWEESVTCSCRKNSAKPFFAVFLLKYLFMMVVGITSGVWLIGKKTIMSWRDFICGSRCDSGEKSASSKTSDIGSYHSVKAADSVVRSLKSSYPISLV